MDVWLPLGAASFARGPDLATILIARDLYDILPRALDITVK